VTRQYTEIVVVGGDEKGLIARVTSLLFERGVNIEDLDQAVREGVFRMTLHVDTDEMIVKDETLRDDLHGLGDELGVDIQVRFPSDRGTDRLAVLVTKESHCLEALFQAREEGELDAEISVVIGNHPDLEPLAAERGVDFHDIGDGGVPDENRLLDLLAEYEIDLVVLARYMRILSPNVVFRSESRIINVHPSLLPAFPGASAYMQAIEEGVRIAGVTAHYVTTDLDQGPIITQRAFDVPDDVVERSSTGDQNSSSSDDAPVEALRNRGQPLEADALLEAVKLHLNNDVSVHRGRTTLRDDAEDYQLGLTQEATEANPDRPLDGIGGAVADAESVEESADD
jgi:formyltetrahydrofolate deformylase